MNRSSDPFAELRRADPVRSDPTPSESKARVWARIQEATMDSPPTRARRMRWALGLGAATLGAAVAVAVLVN